MGVTGLWKLIEPCGQPVPVEMLENKILAVDISIWLHQAVKGFQDNKGSALANSHLLGLFHRLCKLMYYRIKPVFVFDGKVPSLKKETIAKRNLKRNKLINEADRIQNLLLQSLAKEKVVQQALGPKASAELLKASPSKNRLIQKRPDIDDMFRLPDLPPIIEASEESDVNTTAEISCSDSESSFAESKPQHHNENLQAIDVKSKYFCNLPADIRHEILVDIKETRKQSSWGKLHELPSKSNDFSLFQMKRLLKRRQVQTSLEEAEKEMDGVRTFTLSELEQIFSEDGIIEPSTLPNTKHISSDANTRFLLVRDLKKTLATAVAESKDMESKPETSASALAKEKQNALGEEYDDDLQRAIQMSLEDSAPYNESDYKYNTKLKLNKEQRKNLKDSAIGLARAYMIEHAGMNSEDVDGLLEHTQNFSDDDEFNFKFGASDEKETMKTTSLSFSADTETEKTLQQTKSLPASESLSAIDVGKEAPSDLENMKLKSITTPAVVEKGVENKNSTTLKNNQNIGEYEEVGVISDSSSDSEFEICENTSDRSYAKSNLEIFVDPSKHICQDDDLFSDVFSTITEKKTELKLNNVSNVTTILQDLKKQASEVTKINLTDIKLDPSIIDISDDESLHLSQSANHESDKLGILQSAVVKNISVTPSNAVDKSVDESERLNHPLIDKDILENLTNQTDKITEINQNNDILNSKIKTDSKEIIEIIDDDSNKILSPFHTPSKTKSISEFFETKYVVKRTPEKSTESIEDVPKVKSPFFIKRTPKSSNGKSPGKRSITDDECSPQKKTNKAAKMLFEKSNENENEIKVDSAEMAANILKDSKSREQLEDMASSLAKERVDLEMERNRQDRMGMTINERMTSECMQLLRLFGVPFMVAPMEAEAQCAFLDANQLTNGTITDDSDIWLFGGRTVYKNFFAQNKHVMEFKLDKIENSFNVDRNKLVQLALLVGSDYTIGVNGIGAVTALEILATFSTNKTKDVIINQHPVTVLETLRNFRDWWITTKSSLVIGNTTRHRLRNKLKNIDLIEGFPSPAVVEAYLTPTVDKSQETFSWGSPDTESIREFTRTNFGWTRLKTDEILGPVLKRMTEKKSQLTIKNYFAVKSSSTIKELPVSKRVQNAINKMSVDYKSDEEKTKDKTNTKPKRGKRKHTPASTDADQTNKVIQKKTARINNRNVSTTTSTDIIPQRLNDIKEMARKKELAATVLKTSKIKNAKN